MARQERNVLTALPQSRNLDGDHTQAVVEVFAKTTLGNLLFEVFVRCGDDADVHGGLFGAADRANLAFLENTVELYLHRQTHVANLVHKERSAVRRLE